jgi:hypothetical protein
MRLFDIAGAILVGGWLVFAGAYVWHHEAEPRATTIEEPTDDLRLQEGERWMLLRRYEETIGYVRRRTTRLADGWLFEYEVLVVVDVTGRKYGVDAEFDARVDADGVMKGFSASGELAGRAVSASGNVDDNTIRMTLTFGQETREQSITLEKPPRLTGTRLPAIAGDPNLEPGDRIRQSVFAPTQFGMQSIVFEVVGRRQIDLMTRKAQALYLIQHVAGEEYDLYLADDGSILLREFPFRIYGVYTTPEFASARAATLRKRLDDAQTLPEGTLEQAGGMLDMMGGGGAPSGFMSANPMQMLQQLGGAGNHQEPRTGDAGHRDGHSYDTIQPEDVGIQGDAGP